MITPFSIARLPRIEFGSGCIRQLPDIASRYPAPVLLVTGAQSFVQSVHWQQLTTALDDRGIGHEHLRVGGEPSPSLVDEAVARLRASNIGVVVGIGGGSVLDAAKAIAGLLGVGDSVLDYLEGVGPERDYVGPAVPFIAVPTTAGTGSEATKNAVLSLQARDGYKKSFRDEQLVPEYAIVDPDLLQSCPADLIAANGMDALTQLMESYVSTRANPMTDALAISGLRAARDGLLHWYHNPDDAADARARMAYAALISGITLAQTGLGSVHGLASPLGAFFPIPHGVVCGTLVATATRVNLEAMQEREPANPAAEKYARLAEILNAERVRERTLAHTRLVELLQQWTEQLNLPRLGEFGVQREDFAHVVANSRGSSMRTNPIVLTDGEIESILLDRL